MQYLIFLIGVLIGVVICRIVCLGITADGVLRIDHSDPEIDKYRLDVDALDMLSKKKRIVLKVDNNADLSQE